MTIHWLIRVKFRVFFVTIGTLERSGWFEAPVPVPVSALRFSRTLVDERGVLLRVWAD